MIPTRPAPGRMTTKWGGFVSDVAGFDAEFFGITPREAEAMDPQQRMLLEVAWEALEHAGIPPDSLGGSRTGVIVGMSSWDYTIVNIERRAEIDAYLSTGNPHSTAVGRISYLLGLRGPAVAVDTACSSSLVAVHLACQSLRLRESDLALAGGVQLSLSPFTGIALSKWSALSPQGRCKTFDAGADGFVRGEGCGVVVLKRLADALRDGDRVLAVVRGSAVNQDGRSNGLTAPNALAQRDVITDALRAGDVARRHGGLRRGPRHRHGAGRSDRVRGAGSDVRPRAMRPCALGAVKTNLGHLEAAAGVAGFIKAVLALQHGHDSAEPAFHPVESGHRPVCRRGSFVPTEHSAVAGSGRVRGGRGCRRSVSAGRMRMWCWSRPRIRCRWRRRPEPAVIDVGGVGQDGRSGWRRGRRCWRIGWTVQGPQVGLADVAHTLNHHRARHATFAHGVRRRSRAGGGRVAGAGRGPAGAGRGWPA